MDNFSAVERAKQARRKRPALNQRNYSDPALRFGWAVTWILAAVCLFPFASLLVLALYWGYGIILLACVIIAANRGRIGPAIWLLIGSPLLIIASAGLSALFWARVL